VQEGLPILLVNIVHIYERKDLFFNNG